MNIRLWNARILTMEETVPIFEGEIWVQQDRITYVGAGKEEEVPVWDMEIDCERNLLMPGFKNAHTHSGMTLLRSYADDLPLHEWLHGQVFPVEAKMNQEDIYYLTKLAVLEYLTSGVTSIFDMYLTPESIASACSDTGMRCVLTGAVNNFSQSVEQMESWYEKFNEKESLISFLPGFHAEYTSSKELMAQIASLAHRLKAPVYVHLSETKEEVEGCVERYGMTPGIFLDSLGMFEYGGGIYHGVYLTEEEIALFKKKNIHVVTNPGSNTKLASGIAPIQDFLKAGLNVAIGTDGPASNNSLDMFREMFLVTGLAKLREKDASAVDAMEVLKMATVNGARAMCLEDADVLAPGKLADLIMIDLQQPNMQPINNIAKNIVYSGSKQNVKMTMINGRILYRDGKFYVGEEAHDIYEKANEIINRLK
ncbi:amidohydrolase [Kineothrix sp. MB12-C1]|uniref:amidohydrolase n=1 Tax=Kineothrix sp. MB12-C1 TaxID=3070215 RepID=UPI0027D22AE7|nr:amidohydrolase [Kineothrix sp. MB12-C1]WMC92682.1 amidohydrolase [Kineothrix sp. MB12-C1]